MDYSESEITGLVKFDEARRAVEIASTIDEVKDIRDKAEAMRAYAKQAHLSLGMQNKCAEIRIRCERRGGEILKETTKAGNPQWSHDATIDRLEDIGISKSQSSRWQAISQIPEPIFENHIREVVEKEQELTSSGYS